jgi:hypothetical protein
MVRSLFLPESKAKDTMTGNPVSRAACHGQARLGDVAHGFNQQCIRAGRCQGLRLRGKGSGRLFAAHLAGEQHLAGGADGGKDQRRTRGLARECDARAIDRVQIGLRDAFHGDGVGAKGVGENDLAARHGIGARHRFHLFRMGEVPCVRVGAGRQAARLQLGSPGAIGDEQAVGQPLAQAVRTINHGTQHTRFRIRMTTRVGHGFAAKGPATFR